MPVSLSDLPERDQDGYVDLRSYAVIGDGRTVALVAHDGSIDWLPLPDLDSMPVFGRLLDGEDGGHFSLCPQEPFEVERAYEESTNVLVSTYTTESGTVTVTDALNIGATGTLPWGELARRVDGVAGEVAMSWCIAPGTGLNTVSPWAEDTENGAVLRLDAITMALRPIEVGDVHHEDRQISGGFTTSKGSVHLLGLVSSYSEPLRLPRVERVLENLEHTKRHWRNWSAQFTYDGRWKPEALRSAMSMKLLSHEPSGAIAAAATTSLPENPDGGKNWDYRFAWLRDATYTLHCMIALGEFEEVHAEVSWLLRVAREHEAALPVLARLDGTQPDGVHEHDVPGWRGIGPVVSGNQAADQLQLGVYGDLFDMVDQYVSDKNVLDIDSARFLAHVADRTCDIWHRPDAGMWELEEYQHYTSSKMGCWQALECAVRLAESGHIPGSHERWARERDRIKSWVEENCWSPEREAYVWFPGSQKLDASVLLHAGSGFDSGPRMSSTVDALRAELGAGPLMYRFSGAQEEEKTFTACAFWTASALAELGRVDEAEKLMTELLPLVNDVGVLTEMIDADDLAFWGNLPQALSHLALLTAVLAVDRAKRLD